MSRNTATGRFEFRVRPGVKARIERAAAIAGQSTSDFARTAAEERAEQILAAHEHITVVPAACFDALLAELDHAPVPNEALQRAAQRARQTSWFDQA